MGRAPVLVALLLSGLTTGLLTGCGGDSESADDPASTPTASPSASPTGTAQASESSPTTEPTDDLGPGVAIGVVHAPNAGGEVTTVPTRIDSRRALREYAASFDGGQIAQLIRAEIRHSTVGVVDAPDLVLVAAVIQIGCQVPDDVVVAPDGSLEPGPMPKSNEQCFVAHTSVGIAALPADSPALG